MPALREWGRSEWLMGRSSHSARLPSRPVKRPRWLRSLAARTNRTAAVDWSTRPPEEAWQASIDGEVRFWKNWLATRGEKYPESYDRVFNAELEQLPSEIPPDSFDLVAARNTLDHSYDPVRPISQMVSCAKNGAPILLVHHSNTAEKRTSRVYQWYCGLVDQTLRVAARPAARRRQNARCAGHVRAQLDGGTWEHVVFLKA